MHNHMPPAGPGIFVRIALKNSSFLSSQFPVPSGNYRVWDPVGSRVKYIFYVFIIFVFLSFVSVEQSSSR